MTSGALGEYTRALAEVRVLHKACPQSVRRLEDADLSRAICRSGVVMLCSHFERYIRSANEELVGWLNAQALPADKYPLGVRLLHVRPSVEHLAEVQWDKREKKLCEFVGDESWMFTPGGSGAFEAQRLLSYMRSPKPKTLVRYYRGWGIVDIFKEITRKKRHEVHLRMGIQNIVDLRNNIAHGDYNTVTTRSDLSAMVGIAATFASRSDKALGRAVSKVFGIARPW